MKTKDIVNLMNRASAAIDDPESITAVERRELVLDLNSAADDVEKEAELADVAKIAHAKRVLEEVNTVLCEMGWHGDRGLLHRVNSCLQTLRNHP